MQLRKKKLTLGIGATVILGVVVVLYIAPWWCVERRGYNCRLCGAQRSETTTRVIGVPVCVKYGAVKENSWTDIYARHIAEPHKHQWAGGGWSRTAGTLRGTALHSDGLHFVPGFFPLQFRLTHTALEAVRQVKNWPVEERKKLYHAILDATDEQSYRDVQKVFEKAKNGAPKEIWREWLSMNPQLRKIE